MTLDHPTIVTTEDERDRLALHEAGRAVVATYFCRRVAVIELAPMRTRLLPRRITDRRGEDARDADTAIVIGMAGSAAEIRAGYRTAPDIDRADWRAAWRTARRQGYTGVARAWHVTRCVQYACLLLELPAYRDALDALTATLLRRAAQGDDRLEGRAANRLIAASLERTSTQSWIGCCRHADVRDGSPS